MAGIPTAPKPPRGTVKKPTYTSTAARSSGSSSPGAKKPATPGAGAGGGGSAYDKYVNEQRAATRRAEAKAKAQEAEARRKEKHQAEAQVGKLRFQNQALLEQTNGLTYALSGKGFKKALRVQLQNVNRQERQQRDVLMDGFRSTRDSLLATADDNLREASDKTFANRLNRNRERASAVTEAMNHGAGESDVLNSQMMALRNWSENQNEVNRSFFDTLRSINSSVTDLNKDTRTARAEIEIGANSNREKLWNNYYKQRSDTQNQLGNIYGQVGTNRSDIAGILGNKEIDSYSKKGTKRAKIGTKRALDMSEQAFQKSAQATGQAWRNPGISPATMNWEGAAPIEGGMNNTELRGQDIEGSERERKRPEGAKLRSWRD